MDFDASSLDDPLRNIIPQIDNKDKQPTKPKRPLNAYNLFFLEKQPKMKSENPLMGGNEISKVIGAQWAEMSQEEKLPYIQKAKEIHEQFKKDNPDWHYGKSAEKGNKKRQKNQANYIFDPDFVITTEAEFNTVLETIGALALSQYILSRKDLQEEVSNFVKNQKNPVEPIPFDESRF